MDDCCNDWCCDDCCCDECHEDGKTYVTYSNGSTEKYSIVGELSNNAYSDSCIDDYIENVTDVVDIQIGTNVTSIGERAFQGCMNLQSVTIPDSVTRIGENAFCGCCGLWKVAIMENGGDAENVKQMLIDAGVSSSVDWGYDSYDDCYDGCHY